jgi:glycosyltransferase involved in cell wall biosynthesis
MALSGEKRADHVTVVIPTHNRLDVLPLTLASVLWQRNIELDIVVVDDGSAQAVAPVVEQLADNRVRVVRQQPAGGLSAARNRGAAEAHAEWLAFVDDDDLWAPDKLALQVAAARQAGVSWVYTGAVNVTLDLRVLGGAPPPPPNVLVERLKRLNAVPGGGSGVLMDAKVFHDLGGFSLDYRHHADWDLWLRLCRIHPPACVQRPLIGYRIHTMNRSLDTEGMLEELDLLERRYRIKVDHLSFLRHVARVSMRAGRNRDALRYYLRAAAQMSPSYLLGDFGADAWRALSAGLRGRLPDGRLRRLLNATVSDRSYPEWLDQGKTWVRELQPYAGEFLSTSAPMT